jgi:adenosine deaminase
MNDTHDGQAAHDEQAPHHFSLKKGLIDLHRHLDGNIRVSSIFDLAQKHNIVLPVASLDLLEQHIYIQDKTSDLLSFLTKLDVGVSVLGDLDDCRRIAYENVQDAVNENLIHVELRFSPYFMAQAFKLPLEGVVEAVIDGVRQANIDFGFNAKLIGILSRTYGVDACFQELDAILSGKDNIVALDLAGDEKGFPAKEFVKHFSKARDAGLNVTVHAGEADGSQSIWDAINLLGATRIGHGVAAFKDPKLLHYLCKERIGVESCILSNYQTGTWTDIENHPVSVFLDHDIQVSLHTDDPGVSNNTLLSEYELAQNLVGLSNNAIAKLKQNALAQAFLTDQEKRDIVL